MYVRKSSVLLLAMLTGASVSQREHERKAEAPDVKPEEAKAEEKIIIDRDPELKKELEELEKNGKSVEDQCIDDYCFQVKQLPYCYHDYDCCCPTGTTYYHPSPFTDNGVTWYPLNGQWVKVGKCLSTDKICHKKSWPFTYQKCRQLYQGVGFIFYSFSNYFQTRIKYFILPYYCYCPCGSPWCQESITIRG